jgi:hypothetical protein
VTRLRRRVALSPPADFAEVAAEQAGPVRVRYFRSLLARPMVDGALAGGRVPEGAIVWADAPEAFPEAAAARGLPGPQDGPHALAEPADGGGATPTVREAVSEALAALPEGVREGAAEEVEAALAAVGL